MTSTLRRRLIAGLVGLTASLNVAGAAQADTTLTYSGASGEYVVEITPDAVRIDGDGSGWQLYRQGEAAFLSVEPDAHAYTRLDKNTAGQIKTEMDALRARIEQRLQNLPKGKRLAARVAMADQVPGLNDGGQVGLDQTGAHDTVAGVPCDIYQIVRDGQPASALCVADADALNMASDDFDNVKSMFALLDDMLAGTGLEGIGLPYQHLTGMPIRFVDSVTGERRTLTSVSHRRIPANHFDIPSDYVEQQPQHPSLGG